MSSQLDLHGLHRTFDPDPVFVARLRERLEAAANDATGTTTATAAPTSGAARAGELHVDPVVPVVGAAQPQRRRWVLSAAAAILVLVGVGGVAWSRLDDPDPPVPAAEPATAPVSTVPGPVPATSGGMWPQSTLDEVRAAQELADAGDPAYTWQLDATLAAIGEPWGAEIFARFMEEELGWEEFSVGSQGYAYGDEGGRYEEVVFVRCAPGEMNPLSSQYAEAPPEIRGCAPTIDELSYETVRFSAIQPGRRGPTGIWVIDQWEMLQPADPGSLWELLDPDFSWRQAEQAIPPSDADVTAFLETFLRARVDGEGAEQYLLREPEGSWADDREVPVLYATTGGIPYERFEIERLQGPVWPTGSTEHKVRLFAEDGTVVEQYFHVVRHDGQLGLVYGYASNGTETNENGQAVAVPRSEFGGALSFTSPPLVPRGDGRIEIALGTSGNGRVVIAEDPGPDNEPGCESGPAPADAETLARSLEADPEFETTEPVPVSVVGIDGLQMDLVISSQELCYDLWSLDRIGPAGDRGWRMRLYIVDYPESAWQQNWTPRVLTIAVIAPESDFERVLEEATPIVESVELHSAVDDQEGS